MAKRSRQSASLILVAMAAMALTACAAGPEFQGVPQEGASKTGAYPKLGIMPKAATEQFTPEEQQNLTGTLDTSRTRLKAGPSKGVSPAEVAARRKEAQDHNASILKQIESGEAQ